jgi:hypothetical protein
VASWCEHRDRLDDGHGWRLVMRFLLNILLDVLFGKRQTFERRT